MICSTPWRRTNTSQHYIFFILTSIFILIKMDKNIHFYPNIPLAYICFAQWTTQKAWGGLRTVACLITHLRCGRQGHHDISLSGETVKCNRRCPWVCVLNRTGVGPTQIQGPIHDLFTTLQIQERTVCLSSACLLPLSFYPFGTDFAFHYFAVSQLDAIRKART